MKDQYRCVLNEANVIFMISYQTRVLLLVLLLNCFPTIF